MPHKVDIISYCSVCSHGNKYLHVYLKKSNQFQSEDIGLSIISKLSLLRSVCQRRLN